MLKKTLFIIFLIAAGIMGLYHSPNGYLVPGYHTFFYTPAEYKLISKELQNYREEIKAKARTKNVFCRLPTVA
jgi:hypothetical protein